MGFVIMNEFDTGYRYISYYHTEGSIHRIAYNKVNNLAYPNSKDKAGYNFVSEYILSIEDSNIDFENRLINLNIKVGLDDIEYHSYKSTIGIRCPVDY